MINSDQLWRPFVLYSDIIHLGFLLKEKPIEPRTIPSKDPPNKKNQKESNKLLEKSKGILTSLPQGMEDPEVKKTVIHVIDQRHPIKLKTYRGYLRRHFGIFEENVQPIQIH